MNKPSTVLAYEDAMWYVQHVSVRRVMLCVAADRHPVTPIPVDYSTIGCKLSYLICTFSYKWWPFGVCHIN